MVSFVLFAFGFGFVGHFFLFPSLSVLYFFSTLRRSSSFRPFPLVPTFYAPVSAFAGILTGALVQPRTVLRGERAQDDDGVPGAQLRRQVRRGGQAPAEPPFWACEPAVTHGAGSVP